MTKQELEQQKIMLTKEYEKILEKINRYSIWKIVEDSWPFKDLIRDRDRIILKIEEIKKQLEKDDLS